jgi:hypothetical protein
MLAALPLKTPRTRGIEQRGGFVDEHDPERFYAAAVALQTERSLKVRRSSPRSFPRLP